MSNAVSQMNATLEDLMLNLSPVQEKEAPKQQVVITRAHGKCVATVKHPTVRDDLRGIFSEISQSMGAEALRSTIDVTGLARSWPAIERAYKTWCMDIVPNAAEAGTAEIMTAIQEEYEVRQGRLTHLRARGKVEFSDIDSVFEPGKMYMWHHDDTIVCGIYKSGEFGRTFFGNEYFAAHMEVTSLLHRPNGVKIKHVYIGDWEGMRDPNTLPIQIASDEAIARGMERFAKAKRFEEGAAYMQYEGQVVQPSWWSDRSYRADGRVMVDLGSLAKIDNDLWTTMVRTTKMGDDSDMWGGRKIDTGMSDFKVDALSQEQRACIWPWVGGFSMRAKMWGLLCLDGLSDITFRDNAFDQLVLPDDEKRMVRALVEHSDNSFSDIIDGKGGGVIFLLHGKPGLGKTLTAETVAEVLRRPLYSVSIGELGTNPDMLEKRLREVLDLCTIWNAVLLLDEADIFLEARTSNDLVRNAMVGVFLRLLEYHQGVLFLTTNRVKNIDPAFYSRISVAMHFAGSDPGKSFRIWSNLLEAAGIALTGEQISGLASHDINGRQIKNTIRLVQVLARAEGREVDPRDFHKIITMQTKFQEDMQ